MIEKKNIFLTARPQSILVFFSYFIICVVSSYCMGPGADEPLYLGPSTIFRGRNLICLSEGRTLKFMRLRECAAVSENTIIHNGLHVPSPSCSESNLLSLGQVDPQLPPGGELLPVAEVVGHFLAGVPRHQRGAVLHELVSRLHVS